jgi:HEAT repeat protein
MTHGFADRASMIIRRLHPDGRDRGQSDLDAIWESGADTYRKWLDALQGEATDLSLRLKICWMLGRLGDKRSLPVLLKALDDPAPQLRKEAALALGTLTDERAVPALIDRLHHDPDVHVRAMAAHGLGLAGDARAVKPLLTVLQDKDEHSTVRAMAAETLAALQASEAVSPLVSALRDDAIEVRFWAAFALGELGGPDVIPHLAELAERDPGILTGWWSVRQEALGAVEQIRNRP